MSDEKFGGWDQVDVPDQGGKFYKFPDGQIVSFVLVGTPKIVMADFGQGPKPRVRANLVDLAEPTVARVVEFSAKQAKTVKSLFELSDTGQATIIKCKRTGTGLSTEYTFVAGKSLTDDQRKKLAAIELHSLEDDASAPATAPDDDEEVPF